MARYRDPYPLPHSDTFVDDASRGACAGPSSPHRAVLIKRLRLNHVYGEYSRTILHALPGLRHLCLNIGVTSGEDITPLSDALSSINPTRVSLCDGIYWDPMKEKGMSFISSVCKCIEGAWSNTVSGTSIASFALGHTMIKITFLPCIRCYITRTASILAGILMSLSGCSKKVTDWWNLSLRHPS